GFRVTEAVADLVHEDPVPGTSRAAVERWFHRLRRDLVDPPDESLEDEDQDERDHHQHGDLYVPGLTLLLAATSLLDATSRGPVFTGPRLGGVMSRRFGAAHQDERSRFSAGIGGRWRLALRDQRFSLIFAALPRSSRR